MYNRNLSQSKTHFPLHNFNLIATLNWRQRFPGNTVDIPKLETFDLSMWNYVVLCFDNENTSRQPANHKILTRVWTFQMWWRFETGEIMKVLSNSQVDQIFSLHQKHLLILNFENRTTEVQVCSLDLFLCVFFFCWSFKKNIIAFYIFFYRFNPL